MKKDKIWIALFLFAVLAFFHPLLSSKVPIPTDVLVNFFYPLRDSYTTEYPRGVPYKNPLISDPVTQQIPWRALSVDLIKSGQLPLWNPYQMAGYPLFQNIQSASFYIFNIFFFIFPFIESWSLYIILEVVLAGIFMYLYLRNQNLSAAAAFFGGITFSFSGFFISWLEWGTIGHTALWAPLMLLSVDRFLTSRRLYWLVILVFSLACALLAGHLQTFIYIFLTLCGYIIYQAICHKKITSIFPVFLSIILFIFITAVLWIPQLQFVLQSARNVDQDWHRAGWFIPIQNIVQFIGPNFFGNPATGNYWGLWNYGEFVGYVGIAPLLFAILALWKKVSGYLFWFVLLAFVFLFAYDNPISHIPFQLSLPFIASTQPTRLIFLADLALSILAAKGLENFMREKKNILQPFILFSILFLGIFLYGFIGVKLQVISAENFRIAFKNLIVPFILFFAITSVLIVKKCIKKIHSNIFVIFIIFLTVFDLLYFAQKYTVFSNKEYFYPKTKIINYLTSQKDIFRVMTTDRSILHPNISTFYRIQSVDGYDPLYLQRFGEFMTAVDRDLPDISGPFGFNRIVHKDYKESSFYNLLGVKYILSLTDITEKNLRKVYQEGETRVYENVNVFPRVFFVGSVKKASSKNEAITMLFEHKSDLYKTAIVENTHLQDTNFSIGEVTILKYSENKIVIKTKNNGEGFLVLTDAYYPSWSVSIDGKKQTIVLTDFTFRGVVVPKGDHKVEFKNNLI